MRVSLFNQKSNIMQLVDCFTNLFGEELISKSYLFQSTYSSSFKQNVKENWTEMTLVFDYYPREI